MISNNGPATSAAAKAGNVAASSLPSTGGASGPAGLLSGQKDAKEASTDAKFGDVLKNIQAKYGAKAEKPREIKKTLGKDDFLRMMITQMQHQDPTSPFKAEQMATEMAQFTSIEQLQNVNQNLNKMAAQNQPLERLAMTNLIGKTVTIDQSRFNHIEGQNESLSFQLPRDSKAVKVAVLSEGGDVMMEKELGAIKQGEFNVDWDGLKNSSLPAKAGTYMIRIEAKDEKEQSITMETTKKSRVVGISFEGSEAVVLVGNNKTHDRIPFKNLIKIEADLPAGADLEQPGSSPKKAPNFFSFQKGVGSSPIDPGRVNPEAAAALSGYDVGKARSPQVPGPQAPGPQAQGLQSARSEERGFPNGLTSAD